MCNKILDFLLGTFVVTYIPLAFLVGAYASYHDCLYAKSQEPDVACSLFAGAGWPIYLTTKGARWVMNPERMPEIKLPSFKLEWN